MPERTVSIDTWEKCERCHILLRVMDDLAHEGFPPSIRELMQETGIPSTSLVRFHLDHLERARIVAWEPRLARTLRLTDYGRERVSTVVGGTRS